MYRVKKTLKKHLKSSVGSDKLILNLKFLILDIDISIYTIFVEASWLPRNC